MKTTRQRFVGGKRERRGILKIRKLLGSGQEGTVNEAIVTLTRDNKSRSVKLAAKEIEGLARKKQKSRIHNNAWANPKLQFFRMRELIETNKKYKLGLRLPKTLRITYKKGKLLLMTTFVKEGKNLTTQEWLDFWKDVKRQVHTARGHGFILYLDSFMPSKKKGEKTVANIVDFGNIEKLNSKDSRTNQEIDRQAYQALLDKIEGHILRLKLL